MNVDMLSSSTGNHDDHNTENAASVTKSAKIMNWKGSSNPGGQLFPGILDDITLEHIVPKLCLADFRHLFYASNEWAKAIQSGLVYNTRVRAQSTQTFVVFYQKNYDFSVYSPSTGWDWTYRTPKISLYSMRDGSWDHKFRIPRAPGFDRDLFECVSLDGKLYILGGHTWVGNDGERRPLLNREESKEVYVLNPAGAREWKQCASMLEPGELFNAIVIDGKIYVFSKSNRGCEVYDPKVDAWSSIAPRPIGLISPRSKVAALGEELIVYDPHDFTFSLHYQDVGESSRVRIYNPIEDRWRVMDAFGTDRLQSSIFSANGRFHAITQTNPLSISVLDMDDQSWTRLQTFQRQHYGSPLETRVAQQYYGSRYGSPLEIVAVDDEIIANARFPTYNNSVGRSRGFGVQEQTEIVWEPMPYADENHILCCIQV